MITIKQKTALIFGLLMGFSTNSFAVFCSMFHYVHPVTGNSVLLLSDIHIDIEATYAITTLQQNALLRAALAQQALVIAEAPTNNAHHYWYSLYLGALLAVFMSQHHKVVRTLCGADALHTLVEWSRYSPLTKNPPFSLDVYLKCCQSDNPNKEASYTCYLKSPLSNLQACCSHLAIPMINVEFRYHPIEIVLEQIKINNPWYMYPVAWSGQSMNLVMRALTRDHMRYPLNVLDCCRVDLSIAAEILQYNDSSLDSFYQQCIADYQSSYVTKMISNYTLRKKNPSIKKLLPILAKKSGKPIDNAAIDFMKYNSRLFDARLVHEIYRHQEEKTIFVCAGAEHIKNIYSAMDTLGYQLKKSYGGNNLEKLQESGVFNEEGHLLKVQVKDLDYLVIDLPKIFATDFKG